LSVIEWFIEAGEAFLIVGGIYVFGYVLKKWFAGKEE